MKIVIGLPALTVATMLISCLAANTATATPTGTMPGSVVPIGVWLLPNQRIQMEIAPCDDRLCGKLVWFKHPNDSEGLPLVDSKNPDPALRARPLLGLTVLHDLRKTDDSTWEDGKIYNPDDGKEYNARMSIQDDGTLHVRAYVVFEVLGKTQILTRVDREQIVAASQRQE